MQDNTNVLDRISSELERQMQDICDTSINNENVDYLYKITDIHKDIANECYWKEKIDNMRYMGVSRGRYDDGYGRQARDSRGRYMMHDDYSMPYRGEEHLRAMQEHYRGYYTGREKYGTDSATLDSLDAMLRSVKDFFNMLKRDAKSQDEMEMIKEAARDIADM